MAFLDSDPFAWPSKFGKPESYTVNSFGETFPTLITYPPGTKKYKDETKSEFDSLLKTLRQESAKMPGKELDKLNKSLISKIKENITDLVGKATSSVTEEPLFGSFKNDESDNESPITADTVSFETREDYQYNTTLKNITEFFESTSDITESPISQSTIRSMGSSDFNLDSAVNISAINFTPRIQEPDDEAPNSNNIKDLLKWMNSTNIDQSIMQPAQNSTTFKSESVEVTETPIKQNPIDLLDKSNEMLNYTMEAVSESAIESDESPEKVKWATEMASSLLTESTTETSSITSTSITTESTVSYEASTSNITSIMDITSTPYNVLKNINDTQNAEELTRPSNTWIFYLVLVVTIGILLMIIGGVFLFYKKVKGGKGSGYQVSQLKEYNSSTASELDTCNVKV